MGKILIYYFMKEEKINNLNLLFHFLLSDSLSQIEETQILSEIFILKCVLIKKIFLNQYFCFDLKFRKI